jgi:very-short-patch-repair endonuclease
MTASYWLNIPIRRVYGFQATSYLVCSKSFDILAAVELDDSSHNRSDRVKADADKDKAIRDAGLKIIRWHVRSLPDISQIQLSFSSEPADLVLEHQRRDPVLGEHI